MSYVQAAIVGRLVTLSSEGSDVGILARTTRTHPPHSGSSGFGVREARLLELPLFATMGNGKQLNGRKVAWFVG